MSAKHSPAPWFVGSIGGHTWIIDSEGNYLAEIATT